MYFINNKVEEKYKPYLLAPLLVDANVIITQWSVFNIL